MRVYFMGRDGRIDRPPIMLDCPDDATRFCDRSTLRGQHVNLPQLRDDLFSRVSLPWHTSVLHQAISHTSGRTTSQGADHPAIPTCHCKARRAKRLAELQTDFSPRHLLNLR
jgi:hypothetical protein